MTFDEWWKTYPMPGGEDYVAAKAAWNAASASSYASFADWWEVSSPRIYWALKEAWDAHRAAR